MKNIFIVLLIMPCVVFSQLIKSNATDSITHQKRIITISATISNNFFRGQPKIESAHYHTINNKVYITLSGNGYSGAGTVMPEDVALLITEKDTIIIQSVGLQASYGKYEADTFNNEYVLTKDDVNKLAASKLIAIKRYTNIGVFETFLKEKFQTNLMQISAALLKEMNK
ncbi:MAG: hypothetical protein JST94_05035 [Bacteroidetes bacterium]|nr:hypothetical protein [Bacteroidota bacterium]MBS1641134.1 hypothetical protein [Bacteroidota bacterium]MBS1670804.1 hypothetical protein [Bacteroidota bacterium]